MANGKTQLNKKVTLSREEYLRLKQQAKAYRELVAGIFKQQLKNSVGDVVGDFKKTGLYSDDFLNDLEDGLQKSSYAKKHANQTAPKRS